MTLKRYRGTVLAIFIVFAVFVGIVAGSMKWLKVYRENVVIKDIPPNLRGLRILLISDLHSNREDRQNINIWKTIDRLDFDIVCITGDIVDREETQIIPHMEELRELANRKPMFFVEGNHEYERPDTMRKLAPLLESCGLTIVTNRSVIYDFNGGEFEITGLREFYNVYPHFKRENRLLSKSGANFRLILAHQPQYVDYIDTTQTPSLILTGHTHGGQIRIPFVKTIYAPGQGFFPKYGYGLYEIGDNKLFVSKGIGVTGNMPVRFWNRPEICLLTLE